MHETINRKKLIIGKNSTIVSKIAGSLVNFDFVSHRSIEKLDYSEYQRIFLFSWSHESWAQNLSMLQKIDLRKLVFISTTAVFSLHVRKQWNKYPNWKLAAENMVLKNGGSVLRIGVWDENVLSNSVGYIPITSPAALCSILNNFDFDTSKTVTVAEVAKGKTIGQVRVSLTKIIHHIALRLPAKFVFQAPLELIVKKFLSSSYGYSADSALFFCDTAIIGYGAIGSSFYLNNFNSSQKPRIVVSGKENILLNNNGFIDTRIGRRIVGLSEYWHGASVAKRSPGFFIKYVPFFVRRPAPPIPYLVAHVSSIEECGNQIRLNLESEVIKGLHLDCKKVILSAGAVENCRLLRPFSNESYSFSDHEIGMIGKVPLSTLKRQNYINVYFGIFIAGRRVYANTLATGAVEFMVDFRPLNNRKHDAQAMNIYNDTSLNIFKKLIRSLSFEQLNEAIFNKFGFAVATPQLSVFAQIESPNCIKCDTDGRLSRSRLSNETVSQVLADIKNNFDGFLADSSIHLSDGQHIMGGEQLLRAAKLQVLIKNGSIQILGSPTSRRLGAFHHTVRLLDAQP
jgi:hypothetical protein